MICIATSVVATMRVSVANRPRFVDDIIKGAPTLLTFAYQSLSDVRLLRVEKVGCSRETHRNKQPWPSLRLLTEPIPHG